MQSLISYLLTVASFLLAVPATVLLTEVLACVARSGGGRQSAGGAYPRIAVLVPAHNESAGLVGTLNDIKAQLRPEDQVLVVADNCTDDTAAVAARLGADVIERFDRSKVGKGYALDFGIRHLSLDPPGIVIVIDADCRLADGTLANLSATCWQSGRPAQALDLMTAPQKAKPDIQFAEFAWRVKNWVRPLGLKNLSLPCQLMGTGMAFSWSVIRSAEIASGQIVEDLHLGLDLAAAGYPALFCPSALVTSQFPDSGAAANAQRQRWEHGHLHTIFTVVPRFLMRSLIRRDVNLLALTLDLSVPPLSLLGLLIAALFGVSAVAAFMGLSLAPLIVTMIAIAAFAAAVLLSWWHFGQDLLPRSGVPVAVRYALGKIHIYLSYLSRRGVSQWVRADRKKASEDTQEKP